MSYTKTLQSFRKDLNKEAAGAAPVQPQTLSNIRGGIVPSSNYRLRSIETQEAPLQYDPQQFVMNAMRSVRQARETFSEKAVAESQQPVKASPLDAVAKALISKRAPEPVEELPDSRAPAEVRADREDERNSRGPSASIDVVGDEAFLNGVREIAAKYNTDPANIMAAMHFETGGSFDPGVRNAAGSGATGLIQFMPSTAKGLGTTTDNLAGMSRLDQLQYVDQYFAGTGLSRNSENNVDDVYMSILWPKAVGKEDDYVLFTKGTKAYAQNSGLDAGGKGYVTKADAARKVRSFVGAYSNVF